MSSGKYEETNPFSRMLLKRTGYIHIYNISIFTILYVSCNIITTNATIIALITVSAFFILIFIDFCWDYSCLRKYKKEWK